MLNCTRELYKEYKKVNKYTLLFFTMSSITHKVAFYLFFDTIFELDWQANCG